MDHRRGPARGRGATPKHSFTLIELLVVIAIIMMLAALALPVLMQATRQARGVNCVTNLKQLASAFRTYSTTYDGYTPGNEACHTPTWLEHMDPDDDPDNMQTFARLPYEGQLYPFYRDPRLVLCPSDRDGNGKFSYSVPTTIRYRILDNVTNGAACLLIVEEHPKYYIAGMYKGQLVGAGGLNRREGGFGGGDRVSVRHSGRTANAFVDAHAALIRYPEGTSRRDFQTLPWEPFTRWDPGGQ